VVGKDKVYDEVQEEIATWERSLEKELKKLGKQVGLVGSMLQLLLHLTSSLDSASPTGTAISGIRYRFAIHRCLDNVIDRPRAGHLPSPDRVQLEESSDRLDQKRGYKGGGPVVSRTSIDSD